MLIVLIAAAIAISAFVIRQWSNVKTIYEAKTNSTETIIRRAEESKTLQRALLVEKEIEVVPPSLDQLDSIIDGKTTPEEVKVETGIGAEPVQSSRVQSALALTEEQRKEKARSRTEESVKELYSYELDLMASLGELKQQALDELRALPKEQQTKKAKVKLGYRYLDLCYELEAESDRKVKEILDALREDLKLLGGDESVADTLWESYCDEKATAKQYYLSKYM